MAKTWLSAHKARFEELAYVKPEHVRGFSEEEIAGVERALGKQIPGTYREFLLWAGRGSGCLLHGHCFGTFVEALHESRNRQSDFPEYPQPDLGFDLPAGHLLLTEHQGYALRSIPFDAGDDPPVWDNFEDEERFERTFTDFTSFLRVGIENAAESTGHVFVATEHTLDRLHVPDDKVVSITTNGSIRWPVLPETLRRYRHLKTLLANFNQVEEVPAWLGELRELETIYFNQNRIRWLPDSFAAMTSLKTLLLSDNPLQQLPRSITRLPALERLDLSHTGLRSVPDLTGLPALRYLGVRGLGLSKRQFEELRLRLAPAVEIVA